MITVAFDIGSSKTLALRVFLHAVLNPLAHLLGCRCLDIGAPAPEDKLACLSEIAQEHGVEWNVAAAASEMLPARRTLLNGTSYSQPLPPRPHYPGPPAGGGGSSHGNGGGFGGGSGGMATGAPSSIEHKHSKVSP